MKLFEEITIVYVLPNLCILEYYTHILFFILIFVYKYPPRKYNFISSSSDANIARFGSYGQYYTKALVKCVCQIYLLDYICFVMQV
jgi:hypothetical protein